MRKLLSCLLLVSSGLVAANAATPVKPYLSYRSQSENSALGMVGQTNLVHRSDMTSHYASLAVTPQYTRSFDSDAILQSLFGWWLQNGNELKITGSDVPDRNEKDWLADWFYLDGPYEGSISFDPVIQNVNVDLSFNWGMDNWVKGMYFRVHAPLTWTKWDLGARFKTKNAGEIVQDYIYFITDPVSAQRAIYLGDSSEFFCKKQVLQYTDVPGYPLPPAPTLIDVINYPLTSARFCGCEGKTKTRLSDIQADFGWDFLSKATYHLGVFVRGVAPTGNRPTGQWLFEPVIGNGHHWELGGGITGDVLLWENQAQDRRINFSLEGHATHLFNALQHRVFDLKDIPFSRYLPAFRSNNAEITPLANLTATTINSRYAAQGEIVALLSATLKNWSLDLGYNFWAQSCEKIRCSSWSQSCYGESLIKNGYSIDLPDPSKWQLDYWSTIHEYVEPVARELITNSDIDYDNAQSKGMSHKVFGHVSYAWMDRDIVPFVGIGGEGEFGRNAKCGSSTSANSCSTSSTCSKNCCSNVALSQWGVWVKGGVSF